MKSLTLELGASRRWRDYDGGRFEVVRDGMGRVQSRVHTPAKYEGIKVPDAIAAGLLAESSMWAAENGKLNDGKPLPGREPNGIDARMLRVTDVVDAGEDPPAAMTPVEAIVAGFARVLANLRTAPKPA